MYSSSLWRTDIIFVSKSNMTPSQISSPVSIKEKKSCLIVRRNNLENERTLGTTLGSCHVLRGTVHDQLCTTNACTTTLAFCVARQNGVGIFVSFLVHCFLYPIIGNNISRDSDTDCSINRLVQEVFRQNGVQQRTANERNHGASKTKDFC